jgi:hypothetical protein
MRSWSDGRALEKKRRELVCVMAVFRVGACSLREAAVQTGRKQAIIVNIYNFFLQNQYSETNVMHILFSLLRIKGLYMFPALHNVLLTVHHSISV